MLVVGGYEQRWGLSLPQEKRVSKSDPSGELIMGINPTHFLEFYYQWG